MTAWALKEAPFFFSTMFNGGRYAEVGAGFGGGDVCGDGGVWRIIHESAKK